MRRGSFVVVAGAAIVAIILLISSSDDLFKTSDRINAETWAYREQTALNLQLQAQDHAGNRLFFFSTVTILLCLATAWVAAKIYNEYADRRRERELLLPDAQGRYPIDVQRLSHDVAQQVAMILASGAMQSAIEQAKSLAAAPHTFNYAPRLGNREPAQLPAPAEPEQTVDASIQLPENAPLKDILAKQTMGKIAYGVLPGGEILDLPIAAGYHILAHGDTRSGKSNFIDGMLVQLHHQSQHYGLRIVAGDFKRELAATWRRSPLMEAVETDPAAIAEMLDEIVRGKDGILERYTQFERLGEQSGRIIRNIGDYARATGERPELTFVILDEINAVIEACDKKDNLTGALKQALQTGAGAGIYLLGGAQYLSSNVFRRDGSKQFVTRAHFGAYDQAAVRMMFSRSLDEETKELVTGQPGRGLIKTVKQQDPQPFQALRCDEDDILTAISLVRSGASSPAEEAIQSETQKLDFSPSETPETSFPKQPISPEIADIVIRLAAERRGKVEIIKTVWGVRPGGSDAYRVASDQYEAITKTASVPHDSNSR